MFINTLAVMILIVIIIYVIWSCVKNMIRNRQQSKQKSKPPRLDANNVGKDSQLEIASHVNIENLKMEIKETSELPV